MFRIGSTSASILLQESPPLRVPRTRSRARARPRSAWATQSRCAEVPLGRRRTSWPAGALDPRAGAREQKRDDCEMKVMHAHARLAYDDQMPLLSTAAHATSPPRSDPSSSLNSVRRRESSVMRSSPTKIVPNPGTITKW